MGVVAYVAGYLIWPPTIILQYTGIELFFSQAFFFIEAMAFGFGISFLAWVLPRLQLIAHEKWVNSKAMTVSIAWLLLSWWPHDRLHLANYESIHDFLYIEYGFHIPTIVAIFVVAYYSSKFIVEFAKTKRKSKGSLWGK